jgi:hypothetical protein
MITSLSLTIDVAAEPVTGTLTDDHGQRHEFVGWLGLSDALSRIGTQHTGPHRPPHPAPTPGAPADAQAAQHPRRVDAFAVGSTQASASTSS